MCGVFESHLQGRINMRTPTKVNRFVAVRNAAKEYGNRFPLLTMIHGYVYNNRYYFAIRTRK